MLLEDVKKKEVNIEVRPGWSAVALGESRKSLRRRHKWRELKWMRWGREREEETGTKGVGGGEEHGRGGVNVKATLVAVNMVVVSGGSVIEEISVVVVKFGVLKKRGKSERRSWEIR